MNSLVTTTGMLIRRELWEHKGAMVMTPAVIAAVIIVFLVLSALYTGINHSTDLTSVLDAGARVAETPEGQDTVRLDFSTGSIVLSDADHVRALSWTSQPGKVMTTVFHELSFGFNFLAFVLAVFYLLTALYADRRDRSILFWKSLPFAESQGIAAKLLTACIVLPLIALLASVAVQLVAAVIMTIVYTMTEHYQLFDVIKEISIVQVFLLHLLLVGVFAIKFLPLASWLMFSSAAAKRSPLGLAIIPPLVIIAVEYFVFQTTVLAEFIGGVFFSFPIGSEEEFSFEAQTGRWAIGGEAIIDELLTLRPLHLLQIALVSVPLLFGALWFRNRDYEI